MVVVNNMELEVVPAEELEKPTPELRREQRTNWSQNIVYSTNVVHEVKSVDEIQALVRSLHNVTVFGTGHTFNFIADNGHNRLTLKLLDQVLDLDASNLTVTVGGGIRYLELCSYLDKKGYALSNLASLTELSVAGAVSTAAHGSGIQNRNLATAVCALEMVTGTGEVVKPSRESDGEIFSGTVVGLGALGVITQLTLDIQPAFTMRQAVYEDLPLAQLQDHFEAIMGSGYTVSLFTDWQGKKMYQMWIKVKEEAGQPFTKPPPELFGAKLQRENVNLVLGMPPERCTEQMGVPGQSSERLPHFRPGFLPNIGNELQSEYFVPRQHAVAAIMAVEALRDQITPLLDESEIRTVAADDLWMSTAYGRDSVAIHFCWKHNWPAVERMLPILERALAPFDPRPHWGKLFAMSPAEIQSKYERLDDFLELAVKYDPKGKFRNEFLTTNIFSRLSKIRSSL